MGRHSRSSSESRHKKSKRDKSHKKKDHKDKKDKKSKKEKRDVHRARSNSSEIRDFLGHNDVRKNSDKSEKNPNNAFVDFGFGSILDKVPDVEPSEIKMTLNQKSEVLSKPTNTSETIINELEAIKTPISTTQDNIQKDDSKLQTSNIENVKVSSNVNDLRLEDSESQINKKKDSQSPSRKKKDRDDRNKDKNDRDRHKHKDKSEKYKDKDKYRDRDDKHRDSRNRDDKKKHKRDKDHSERRDSREKLKEKAAEVDKNEPFNTNMSLSMPVNNSQTGLSNFSSHQNDPFNNSTQQNPETHSSEFFGNLSEIDFTQKLKEPEPQLLPTYDKYLLSKNPEGQKVEEEEEFELIEEEDTDMMQVLGFGGFATTKDQNHDMGEMFESMAWKNSNYSRKYRQYMNRRGGFNKPLDKMH